MPERASDRLRQHFDEHGYVVVRDVLPKAVTDAMKAHVDSLCAKNPQRRPEHLHDDLAHNDPFWHTITSHPSLVDIAALFVGPNIALFATHYIAKPPRTGLPVLWHQDASYWPLQTSTQEPEPTHLPVISLWVAVTRSNESNGCLRVIPGTHKAPLKGLRQTTSAEPENVLDSEIATPVSESERKRAVRLELNPGDVSVHHPNCIHGSDANLSAEPRIGLTIRYISTATRILGSSHRPVLLRGCPVPGVNEYYPKPLDLRNEPTAREDDTVPSDAG